MLELKWCGNSKFADIDVGDVFEYRNELYMKIFEEICVIEDKKVRMNAVDFYGHLFNFDYDEMVTTHNATINIF